MLAITLRIAITLAYIGLLLAAVAAGPRLAGFEWFAALLAVSVGVGYLIGALWAPGLGFVLSIAAALFPDPESGRAGTAALALIPAMMLAVALAAGVAIARGVGRHRD